MAYLKIALLAMVLCYVQGDAHIKKMGQGLHAVCVKETSVPEEMITNAEKGNFANDNRLKCYLKCLFVATSVMDEEGNLDVEVMVALIPESHHDIAIKIMMACAHVVGPNACELSYNMHVCAQKASPEDYFLV